MLQNLTAMPSLPYTNEYGVQFTDESVAELLSYGDILIRKYYRKSPKEFGLEVFYALLRTLTRADSYPKAYFRQALLYRILYELKSEQLRRENETPVGSYLDCFAADTPEGLDSQDVVKFVETLEERAAEVVNLLLAGFSYRDVAKTLKLSKSQIGNEVKHIRTAWLEFNGKGNQ